LHEVLNSGRKIVRLLKELATGSSRNEILKSCSMVFLCPTSKREIGNMGFYFGIHEMVVCSIYHSQTSSKQTISSIKYFFHSCHFPATNFWLDFWANGDE
jgi:hypothetical protein